MKDHEIAKLVNDLTDVAKTYADTRQLRARISKVVIHHIHGLHKELVYIVEPYENQCIKRDFWHVVGDEGLLFESVNGERECREWAIANGYCI